MRSPRKVSPTKAAKILGVHRNTVYAWCHKTLNGEASILRCVEQVQSNKYLLLDFDELKSIKKAT